MDKSGGYTTEELIELYVKKTKELGHIPMTTEIDDDPEMPAYVTYFREFGSGEEIVKKAGLSAKYHHQDRINNQFCNDCLHDPRVCGRDIEDCKDMAELYFRLLEKKVNI